MMVERKVFSMEMRNNVYEKTKGKCALCGKFVRFDLFTIDHIIPLAKGGTNDIENLQCTCKHCNAMKQDFSEKEFLDKMIKILAYQSKNQQPISSFYDLLSELKKRLEYDEKNTSLPETPDYQRINEFRMFVNEKIVTGKIEKEN